MKKLFIGVIILSFAIVYSNYAKDKSKEQNQILRKATRVFDEQENSVSNFDFWLLNNGMIFNDSLNNRGGGIWPRASLNQYVFGAGFWFGCEKISNDELQDFTEISYNPNNATSHFVPGRIKDGDSVISSLKDKYRVYFSTDFDKTSGIPLIANDGPNWPYWIDDTTKKFSNGAYHYIFVDDVTKRNRTNYPFGPSIISDEDICTIYKDTDLNYCKSDSSNSLLSTGYPLKLEVESRISSWNNDSLKDIVLVSYYIKNLSKDTLLNCYVSGMYDCDLSPFISLSYSSGNDRCRYISEDSSLNMGVQWTNVNDGETGLGFGYFGVALIESPAVDSNSFIRNDKQNYSFDEQLKINNFRSITINQDLKSDHAMYNYISTSQFTKDNGSGDKRILLTSGLFNMLPGDTAKMTFCVAFAKPSVDSEATTTYSYMQGVVKKVKLIKTLYYNNGFSNLKDSLHLVSNNLNWGNRILCSTQEKESSDLHDNSYIILRNLGSTSIHVTGLNSITGDLNDPSFAFDRTHYDNLIIAPYSSDSLLVKFHPDTVGEHVLIFSYNNSTNSDAKTNLYGLVYGPTITTTDIYFGKTNIGSSVTPIKKTITFKSINNAWADSVSICSLKVDPDSSIYINGTSKYGTYGFALSLSLLGLPTEFDPASSFTIPVSFVAQKVDSVVAKLSIIDCDGNVLATVKLIGEGNTTGVEETNNTILSNTEYIIFPNPSNDYLNIELLNNNLLSENISIYTLEGIKILDIPFSDKIDVSKFTKGVYVVKLGNKYSRFIKI